jgi:hypothetical protein
MKKLSYLLWIMFFFCSCQDDKREQFMRLVQEWQGKEIRFPKEITFTRFVTDTVDYQIPTSDYKVLIYVDSIHPTSFCRGSEVRYFDGIRSTILN